MVREGVCVALRDVAVFRLADDTVCRETAALYVLSLEDDDIADLGFVRQDGWHGEKAVACFECGRHAPRLDKPEKDWVSQEVPDQEDGDERKDEYRKDSLSRRARHRFL